MRALLASASSIMFDSAFGEPAGRCAALLSCWADFQIDFHVLRLRAHVVESSFTCTGDSDDGFWSTSWGRLEKSTLGHVAEPTSFQQKRTLLSARELTEEDWA